MKHLYPFLVVMLAVSVLGLAACSPKPEAAAETPPIRVEHLSGEQPTQLTLVPDAAKRLDIQTDTVQVENVNGVERTAIPYASIVYDTEGHTWIYTSPGPLTYLRTPVQVETIDGDDAIVAPGLKAGTEVVTVGAEELFGSETEFEEE